MSKPRRKKCDRCYGHIGAHSPFCSYHHKAHRVVGVAMRLDGMVTTYASGFRVLETHNGTWVNLDWHEAKHGAPHAPRGKP